jgi:hypothetical protein
LQWVLVEGKEIKVEKTRTGFSRGVDFGLSAADERRSTRVLEVVVFGEG